MSKKTNKKLRKQKPEPSKLAKKLNGKKGPDINKMSVLELKGLIYDENENLKRSQNNIMGLEQVKAQKLAGK